VQDDPGRKVEFSADHLLMQFGEGMIVKSILGDHNGKLVSTANATRTTVTGDRLDLAFDPAAKESTLLSAVATGKGMAQAEPVSQPGVLAQETRILHSELIAWRCAKADGHRQSHRGRPGHGGLPAEPHGASQAPRNRRPHEFIYGAENRLQHFGAVNATNSHRASRAARRASGAHAQQGDRGNFDPKTGDLALLAQKMDFHYQEGTRQATANLRRSIREPI